MKKFVVERNLPGAGNLSTEELQALSKISSEVIGELGRPYQWIQSFVPKIRFTVSRLPKMKK